MAIGGQIFHLSGLRAITSDMFSKIYVALLGLSTAVLAFLTYYSWSWLQSIGAPEMAAAQFQYYSTAMTAALWISTVILLVIANAVLWTKRAWAIWVTFLFFAAFAVLRYFWLEFGFTDFRMRNSSSGAGVLGGPLIGVILIILMAAIAFFDQFIVTRLRAKTEGEPAADEPSVIVDQEPAQD